MRWNLMRRAEEINTINGTRSRVDNWIFFFFFLSTTRGENIIEESIHKCAFYMLARCGTRRFEISNETGRAARCCGDVDCY